MEQRFKEYWKSHTKEHDAPPQSDQITEEGTPEWEQFKQALQKAARKKKGS